MDYSKYENEKYFPNSIYNEEKELKNLKGLINLSPAQRLRIQELEQIIKVYEEKASEYHKEENRLYELWKNDLYAEYEVTGNPKADQAFAIAWDYGHACGYQEVEHYFSDLVELIK